MMFKLSNETKKTHKSSEMRGRRKKILAFLQEKLFKRLLNSGPEHKDTQLTILNGEKQQILTFVNVHLKLANGYCFAS